MQSSSAYKVALLSYLQKDGIYWHNSAENTVQNTISVTINYEYTYKPRSKQYSASFFFTALKKFGLPLQYFLAEENSFISAYICNGEKRR